MNLGNKIAWEVPIYDDNVNFVLTSDSYVGIDCNGFREIGLVGYFEFEKKFIQAVNGEKLRANFNLVFSDIEDMIFEVEFNSPFRIESAGSLEFTVGTAVVDMSTIRNADNFTFPKTYRSDFPTDDPGFWTGFALKSLEMKFPDIFSPILGGNTTFNVTNMLIDEYGPQVQRSILKMKRERSAKRLSLCRR